jgi:hypothetical protein
MSIAALRTRLDDVEQRIVALRAQVGADQRLSTRLTLSSMENHARDLRGQLQFALAIRAREVVSLRLIGWNARGQIPLPLLSRISTALSDAVAAAAERARRGRVVQRVTSGMLSAVNLQLAAIAPGSTQLFITGDTAPDIFGNSSLTDALNETFGLLQATGAHDPGELADHVAAVGVRSAKRLGDLLAVLATNGLSLEVEWQAPDNEVMRWSASRQEMLDVHNMLSGFSDTETTQIAVNGRVLSLSLRGRFELEAEGRIYAGSFPADKIDEVREHKLGDTVWALIEKSVVVNTLTHTRKETFSLLNIKPAAQIQHE